MQGEHKDEEFKNVPGLQVKQAVVLIHVKQVGLQDVQLEPK
jgi:hypothetical protein